MYNVIPYHLGAMATGNLFDNMIRNFWGDSSGTSTGFCSDLLDKGDHYLLQAELPGFQREEIQLNLNGDTLTISAEHHAQTEQKTETYLQRERSYGSFARSFDLSGIQTENISATYQNGILELTLPKRDPVVVPANRQIEIR